MERNLEAYSNETAFFWREVLEDYILAGSMDPVRLRRSKDLYGCAVADYHDVTYRIT